MAEQSGDPATESTFDLDAAVETIGGALFPAAPEPETETEEAAPTGPVGGPTVTPAPETTPTAPETPSVRPAPKAWPKEMHEHWSKLPPDLQTYWETREKQMLDGLDQYKTEATFGKSLREVLAPYKPMIQAAGLDEGRAVQTLLTAHARLTQGTSESRQAAYQELGKNLGLVTGDPPPTPVDPTVKALQDQMRVMQEALTTRQQADLTDAQQRVAKEVDVFASDTKAHPYFDEVADHIVKLIGAGYPLQEAYETAVMVNPVTKAKEVARIQTEYDAKLRENARLDALPKKKASGVNVHSRETNRTPTEPLGSMEDTMKSTLKTIKERTVH